MLGLGPFACFAPAPRQRSPALISHAVLAADLPAMLTQLHLGPVTIGAAVDANTARQALESQSLAPLLLLHGILFSARLTPGCWLATSAWARVHSGAGNAAGGCHF
jgi:hypothetical protein